MTREVYLWPQANWASIISGMEVRTCNSGSRWNLCLVTWLLFINSHDFFFLPMLGHATIRNTIINANNQCNQKENTTRNSILLGKVVCSAPGYSEPQMWATEVADISHKSFQEPGFSPCGDTQHQVKATLLESGRFSFASGERVIDCVCCRDTRRERWLNSQNSPFECIKRSISDTDRKKRKRGRNWWRNVHSALVTSIDSRCYCPRLRMTVSFAFILNYTNPLKLHGYLKITLIVHYLYFNNVLGNCFLPWFHHFIAYWVQRGS